MVERSAHDGGGRLHPHERYKGGTDGGAEAAGTAWPQQDGETDPGAAKAAVKKKATSPTSRQRRKVAAATEPADVAVRAYLLWEQGAPGDATEHWLRAEQELLAA